MRRPLYRGNVCSERSFRLPKSRTLRLREADERGRQENGRSRRGGDGRPLERAVREDPCGDGKRAGGEDGVAEGKEAAVVGPAPTTNPRTLHPVFERRKARRQDVHRTVGDQHEEQRREHDIVAARERSAARGNADEEQGGVGKRHRTPRPLHTALLPAVEEPAHPDGAARLEYGARDQHHQREREPAAARKLADESGAHGLTTIRTAIATIAAATSGPTTLTPRIASVYSSSPAARPARAYAGAR